MSPLQQATKQGNMELVDLFLEAGVNVNKEPVSHSVPTALQFAAIQGYIGIARRLFGAGANVQQPPSRAEQYGRTALEAPADHGRLDMVQL
ncbi:ankyrin repeat protein [Penicillium hordei]|uniref:Ankyrin repeat protein n=1 Tax=Penicillium hordei TaxID=40994 RepID=A0AAD6EE64_9EURO|nr:ankyrin repeat protein [Penicillium hordei]KAJ5614982.1 ankyrin repeat protein [Penicillium hordei]